MDIYGNAELMELVTRTDPKPYYFLERFFTAQRFSEAKEIIFDDMMDGVRIAPFVMPMVDGKPVVHEGFSSRTFKPAYTRLDDPITLANLQDRKPGEAINTIGNTRARLEAARIKRAGQHTESIRDLEEWMAAQYALTGKYTVSGEGYPTQVVDFGRAAGHTVTLAGADLWSAPTTAAPLDDLEEWSQLGLTNAGVALDLVTMSVEAWNAFRKCNQVTTEYANLKSNGGPIPNISPALAAYVSGKGSFGSFEIEVVNTTYIDANGTTQRLMPAGKVLMSARGENGVGGRRLYGPIQHMKAVKEGQQMTDIYRNEYTNKDESSHNMTAESAPLVVAKRVNGFLAATVI